MIKSNIIPGLIVTIILLACLTTECRKIDVDGKKFLEGGEYVYPAQPDSIGIFPGYNRIRLSCFLPANPNIAKCRVYWNNRGDSAEAAAQQGVDQSIASVTINNIAEGFYTFEVCTYDKSGNASIAVDTIGGVYGDVYVSTLSNRLINTTALTDSKPHITWYDELDPTAIGLEISYKSLDGTAHEMQVPLSEQTTDIAEPVLGDSVQYRTLYLPVLTAIDTFYAAYQTIHFE